jgi:hypothetical protein
MIFEHVFHIAMPPLFKRSAAALAPDVSIDLALEDKSCI